MFQKLIVLGAKEHLQNPKKVVISITNECSMRCRMCYNWTQKDSPETVSPERWIALVKELSKLNQKDLLLNIIGGEPLEKPWALNIVKAASHEGIRTSLTTNATLIDGTLANNILDSGLNTLCISLDSLEAETHDYYRGKKGAHANALNAIGLLAEKKDRQKFEIILQTIILDRNIDDLTEIARWASSKKHVSGVFFMSLMKPHFTDLPDDWHRTDKSSLWPKDAEKTKKAIRELIVLKRSGHKIANSVSQLEVFQRYYENPGRFAKQTYCDVGEFGIYIDSEGNCSVCPDYRLGNIKKKTLEEIWFSLKNIQTKKAMKGCRKNCEFLVNCFYKEER